MKGLTKKITALTVAAVMAAATLAGCSSKEINFDEVVATVADTDISLGLVNFYTRYQQSALESVYMDYYGEAMWTIEVEEGVSYEENVRENALESIKHLYILEDHMGEYDLTITDEELAEIDKVAEEFVAANSEEVLKAISGEKEIVAEVMRLSLISNKMQVAMVADVNTDVSDEEAAQKKLQYISFSKNKTDEDGTSSKMTDEEVEELKKEAEDFLAKAKENGDIDAYAKEIDKATSTITFDEESTVLAEDLMEVANELDEKEFSTVLETDSAFYVMQLVSLFDEEATATEKENIIEERKNERYNLIYDSWEKETEYEAKTELLEQISLKDLGITLKEDEEETEE